MRDQHTNIVARDAAERITYFLSCYRDLESSSYDNADLGAFELSEDDVLWYDSCTSTNDILIERAKKTHDIQPAICISATQSSGRGQHNREWRSAEGNLHLSILYPVRNLFEMSGKLSLEVAMSLVDMPLLSQLKMMSSGRVGIKWPNDLCILHERVVKDKTHHELQKFGGILIEPINDPLGMPAAIVIGIGINANNSKVTEIEGTPITSLGSMLDREVDLALLAAEACYACQHAIGRYARGSTGIFARYYLHDLLYELPVIVENQSGAKAGGIASGVDVDGALKVMVSEEETKLVYDGTVRLA